jgi:hypothetical protein
MMTRAPQGQNFPFTSQLASRLKVCVVKAASRFVL